MERQICARCGAECPPDAEVCRFCDGRLDSEVRPSLATRLIATSLALLLMGICGAAVVALIFGVIGLVLWLASGDVFALWLCLGFGALFGFLFGAGSGVAMLIRVALRSREPADAFEEYLVDPASRSAPGRIRRVVFATLFMTVVGIFFTVASHMIIAPNPPGGLKLWQAAAIFVPISALIGLVLGWASSDW